MDQSRRAACGYYRRADRQNTCAINAYKTRARSVLFERGRRNDAKDIAAELDITQGAVSSTFRRARRKLDAYDLSKDNTSDDIVWKLWKIYIRDFELPDFLDVEIEFVIRGIFGDILPFISWFYSIGELCRYILRYYLFDEDKINADIENHLSTASKIEQQHFKDYYEEQPLIIQGVYVRLCMEVKTAKETVYTTRTRHSRVFILRWKNLQNR